MHLVAFGRPALTHLNIVLFPFLEALPDLVFHLFSYISTWSVLRVRRLMHFDCAVYETFICLVIDVLIFGG